MQSITFTLRSTRECFLMVC